MAGCEGERGGGEVQWMRKKRIAEREEDEKHSGEKRRVERAAAGGLEGSGEAGWCAWWVGAFALDPSPGMPWLVCERNWEHVLPGPR